MRKYEFVTLNCAGYGYLTNENWGDRLTKLCECIRKHSKHAAVIALQELQLGGGKYIHILEEQFPEYTIVLPSAYRKQPRSIVTATLIRNDFYADYLPLELEGVESSLRHVYLQITTKNGEVFRIANVHVPRAVDEDKAKWYRLSRLNFRSQYLKAIEDTARVYTREADLKFIVMGDFNISNKSEYMSDLAGYYMPCLLDTLDEGVESIDNILYSTGMMRSFGLSVSNTVVIDEPIVDKISDHSLILGTVFIQDYDIAA